MEQSRLHRFPWRHLRNIGERQPYLQVQYIYTITMMSWWGLHVAFGVILHAPGHLTVWPNKTRRD